jgi:hypothetical protein
MNSTNLFWSIPILTILACFISFYAQMLYVDIYERYIEFEPVSQFKIAFSKHAASFFALMISYCIAPAFLWSQGLNNPITSQTFFFLCGYAIGILASHISRALSAIFIYKYIEKHHNLISGQTIFKPQATRVINAGIFLQQGMLLAIIAFFIAVNPFIIGALFGLGIMALISYFTKNHQPVSI